MSQQSWYDASKNLTLNFPKAAGEYKCDVAILGAGKTGLSSAIHLAKAGFKTLVLEEKHVGFGASGRSGGQFIVGFSCSLDKMIKLVGEADAKKLFWLSVESIELLKSLIKEYNIDCDLVTNYYHAAVKKWQVPELESMLNIYHKFGYGKNCYLIDRSDISKHILTERYHSLLFDPYSGHLHPLNLTLGLAKAASSLKVDIFENSKITSYKASKDDVTLTTDQATIKAKYLILGGNAYVSGLESKFENRIMPVATYIAASQVIDQSLIKRLIPNNAAVADLNLALDYFRLSGDGRMLYGGRASYSLVPPLNLSRSMYQRMIKTFPDLANHNIEYTWGGLVGITANRTPYFGKIGSQVLFAGGFSGHGVALSLLAGKIMADVISAKQQQNFDLFAKIKHMPFIGGRLFRMPLLVLGTTYFRLKEFLKGS